MSTLAKFISDNFDLVDDFIVEINDNSDWLVRINDHQDITLENTDSNTIFVYGDTEGIESLTDIKDAIVEAANEMVGSIEDLISDVEYIDIDNTEESDETSPDDLDDIMEEE